MVADSYWTRSLAVRGTRRRLLTATAIFGASAVSLAACGSGSKAKSNASVVSSLITRPVDATKEAKRGGVFKWFWKGDPPNFDPSFASTLNRTPKNLANSLLVQIKPGYMAPQTSEVIPDLAESWEVSGDKTEIVSSSGRASNGTICHRLAAVSSTSRTSCLVGTAF